MRKIQDMDQPKIERLLRLMQYLTGNVNYSFEVISKRLGISRRTFFRYLDTFKSAGFVVTRIDEGIYRMANMRRGETDISKIVYFSEEEAYLVSNLIDRLDNTNTMKQGLKRKLAAVYDSTNLANYIDNKENAASINTLACAIRQGRQVILHQYASAHSETTRDYHVEPFKFNTNYIDVWAYDLADRKNKRFKVARIGEVEILKEKWTAGSDHREIPMDVFRIHSETATRIRLRMNLMARNLLVEEYPLAEQFLVEGADAHWYFEGDVRGMEGVGRFVLGLPDSVEILEGQALKDYVSEKAALILRR